MDWARSEEGVDARVLGNAHGFEGGLHVLLGCAGQAADDRWFGLRAPSDRLDADALGDLAHGLEVVG
jgi:hypothetical protein